MLRTVVRRAIDRFPGVARLLRHSRDLLDRRAPFRKTPWGFELAGHGAMAAGAFEPEETGLVRSLLAEVDLLVKAGANIGYYVCHAGSMGTPAVAIEPVQRNLHYLLKNLERNGWTRDVEVFPVALGGATDVLDMWGGGTGASLVEGWASIPAGYVRKVPVLTLDRVLGGTLCGRRALILVDIEGAELMMLEGATRTLASTPRPIWIVEICWREHQPAGRPANPDFARTFEEFLGRGYRAFSAHDPAAEVTREMVAEWEANHGQPASHTFLFR
jgi:FkbM family methyltransferase